MAPNRSLMKTAYPCVHCKLDVSGRQHALNCSVCNRWQHRKCQTGIDHVVYQSMMKADCNFKWKCMDCRPSPEEPDDQNQKETFLEYFALCRVVHKIDSGVGTTEVLPEALPSISFNTDSIKKEIESDDDDMEVKTRIEQDIIGDLPTEVSPEALPSIPFITDYIKKEIESNDDDMVVKTCIEQDIIGDLPTFDLPWLRKSVSVYSEASTEDVAFISMDTDEEVSWLPKITSVYSLASNITNSFTSMVTDEGIDKKEVHKTYATIEECPQCFTVLVPIQFTVNVVTAVMKTTCHCGLSIEIDPKPTFCKNFSLKRKRSDSQINLKRLRFV